ncbi:MAG: FISUMP domain-containing protein, partial [Candidatus Saccharibacteria bacterium]|nr:FISUMP domain-containing protein [Candidatus Saccharibacteria bacterium]
GMDTVAITGSGVKSGGAAGATSTAEVYYDGEITITATPATGYTFTDWSGDTTYTNNPETITNVTSALALTANAIQVDVMQNLDPSLCTTTAVSLVDSRDNQSYIVQRLADGNCWMMTNLNLGATTLANDLTAENTNISTTVSASDFNNWKKSSGSSTLTAGEYISRTGTDATSKTPYATLYNFYAASAGSINGSSNSNNATQDICPAGWRLPTGGANSEFTNLYAQSAYDSISKMRAPIQDGGGAFVLAGFFNNGGVEYSNQRGYYWASTVDGTGAMKVFSLYTTYVNADNNLNRNIGGSIRCILDENPIMQNISSNTLDSLVSNTGDSATLRDTRDNQRYTVTKLADGNVWMTQNLRFTGTELTPADTNVDSNITMNYGDLTTGNSYTQALIHNSGDLTKGVWYNFAAASAGTIASASSSSNATQDICPAGWRLPTNIEIENIVANSTSFNPTNNTGYWYNGTNATTSGGYWYSSSTGGSIARYGLNYVSSAYIVSEGGDRATGRNLRCIYDKSVDMQNISQSDLNALVPSTGSTTILRDSRDHELYRVAKLADGNVWMTQNLRFTGTNLTPTDSNVKNDTTMVYGDLASGNTFDEARIHVSDNSNYGAWYNYAAASAGTITGSSNTNEAASSICPAGWRLPTASEQVDITNYVSTFKPIVGGIYYDNALRNTDYGYWWSSTVYDATLREYLGYNSASTMFTNHTGIGRVNGFYVRCIYDATPIYMQDFSSANAASMATNDLKTLSDNRDNQTYKVAKLADGNIWMIDNLNLNSSTITASQLDSTNTNLDANETLSANTFKSWQTSSPTATYTSGQYLPIAGTDSTSKTKNGTLYNYCAVSAGAACNSTTSNTASDICPKGWRLPIGGPNGDFQKLYSLTNYNTLAKMRSPVSDGGAAFALPGYFNTSHLSSGTAYWTSIAYNSTASYAMSINTSNGVNPTNYGVNSLGFSVRCIYDQNSNVMQNISQNTLNSLVPNSGDSTVLKDSRDNKKYTVTRLSDGNIWMTQNLRFTGTELTPADSNVDSSITLDWSDLATTPYNSYTDVKYHNSDNTTIGVWYNYAGATAGTITGSSSTVSATQDICPKGWRLPNSAEYNAIGSYAAQFVPVNTSSFYNGSANNVGIGYLWSSTAYDATQRYDSRYTGSAFTVNYATRDYGLFVRCVYNKSTMQDFSMADADAMSIGETKALADIRDNEDYNIRKLADGNVWMIQNLRLGRNTANPSTNNPILLTPDDSNVTSNRTITPYDQPTYGGTNSLCYGNGTVSSQGAYRNPCMHSSSDKEAGVWYNIPAATAGTITGSTAAEATQDICPKGWKMPSKTDFDNLLSAMGADFSSYNPYPAGLYANASYESNNRTSWLSTTEANYPGIVGYTSYGLIYSKPSNTLEIGYFGRQGAYSVRCIKKDEHTVSDISNMQDINPTIVANTVDNTTKTLRDTRDNQEYTVAKINGNLWMTRNLAIGCNGSGGTYGSDYASRTLTSADSNVTSNFTTPTTAVSVGGGSYTDPRIDCSDTYGAWYNYAATTAGTITGNGNTAKAVSSLCPSGWRLPTNTEAATVLSYVAQFQPTSGSIHYGAGGASETRLGYYWTSINASTDRRYYFYYDANTNTLNSASSGVPNNAFYVRCIANL